jgi:hypothetical protein
MTGCVAATLCFFVRGIADAVLLQSFNSEGKRTGDGTPEGLPLIVRFSPGRNSPGLAPFAQWRTLILVIPRL